MLKSLGVAALLLTAASSFAQAPAPSARVSYADLDLGGAAGQAALAGRLHRASETVCPGRDSRQLAEQMAARRCARQALLDAEGRAGIAIARARGGAEIRLAAR